MIPSWTSSRTGSLCWFTPCPFDCWSVSPINRLPTSHGSPRCATTRPRCCSCSPAPREHHAGIPGTTDRTLFSLFFSSLTMRHRDQVLRPRNSQYAGNPQAPCGAEVENCFDCDLPCGRPDTADAASHQAASSRQTSLHSRYSPPSRLRQHEA